MMAVGVKNMDDQGVCPLAKAGKISGID